MEVSLLTRIRGWAVPPHLANEDQDRVARLLHYFLIAVMVGASLNFIAILISGVGQERSVFPFIIILVSLCSFVLVRRGRVRFVGFLITTSLWGITTLSAVTTPNFPPPSLSFYALTIILAAVLLDERVAGAFTATSILSILIMVILVGNGQLQKALTVSPGNVLTFFVTLYLATGAVLVLTSRSIRSAFVRILKSEQTLEDRNQELEHQIAERQKVEAERDRLFELSLDLMAVLGSDVKFRRLNPAFETTLGYTEAEMLGKPLHDFVHADDLGLIRRAETRLAEGLQLTNFECRCVRKDGQPRVLSWNVRPVERVIYAVARDITERKEAEQNQMALTLAVEKATILTDFLATTSHDIKTPLAVINTSLYLLERLEDPEKQLNRIQAIKEQTHIVESFIQDILAMSRLDYQNSLDRGSIDLAGLLSEIVRRLSPKAEHKHIQVHLDTGPKLLPISADYDQLLRAFTNLIENALNYTREKGRVVVQASAEAGKLIVTVSDTGIGIREKDLPYIFERFYRSEDARSLEKAGSGLGLAIVKKILDMHEGTVQVTSTSGEGTTFRVELPIAKPYST